MPGRIATVSTVVAATAAGAFGGHAGAEQLWEQPFQDSVKQVACISKLGEMAAHPTYFATECVPFKSIFGYKAAETAVYVPGKLALANAANGNQAGTTTLQHSRVTYSPISPPKFATIVHQNSAEYASSHSSDNKVGAVVGGLLGLLVSGGALKFGPSIRQKRVRRPAATSSHDTL